MRFELEERALYEHRQIGWTMLLILGCVMAILAFADALTPNPANRSILLSTFFLITVVGALFSTLTVRVTPKHLVWWFGPGIIGRRVGLDTIVDVVPVKTSILEGWGIHLTWHGWLWNVSGFNAVEITLRNGTRYALGTPEPSTLIDAISSARRRNVSS